MQSVPDKALSMTCSKPEKSKAKKIKAKDAAPIWLIEECLADEASVCGKCVSLWAHVGADSTRGQPEKLRRSM